jgi:hypothetical protein
MMAMGQRTVRSSDERSERERRLADALRHNLKRRKQQQRKREDASGDPTENPADATESTGDIR